MLRVKYNRTNRQLAASSNTANRSSKADDALLLLAASEGDSNMLYAVGFFVPDPFIFFQHKKKKYVVMSDLELDRAKRQATVDKVLSLSDHQRKLRKAGSTPTMIGILELLFRERGIRSLRVPANFSALLADQLRDKGFNLKITPDPFFPEREIKRNQEVRHITESLHVAKLGLDAGIRMLKKTKTGNDG